jgi:glycosyltransferase involved in cell wall biosynthesis
VVVPCGIPDPFPDFPARLAPIRRARASARAEALGRRGTGKLRVRVLFIALCTREKGIFDAIAAVAHANRQLAADHIDLRFELDVAGEFRDRAERAQFDAAVSAADWDGLCRYHGFVSGRQKTELFEQADMLLFPTYYSAESFPVVVLEAMAAGLAIVATRWRAIPEMFPADYPGLVPAHAPQLAAAQLVALAAGETGLSLRQRFLEHFTLERYVDGLEHALLGVPGG